MNVLVIDLGGSHVKLRVSGQSELRVFDSHPQLTPQELVQRVREQTSDWNYDVVSLGYPGEVGPDGPSAEPGNLGNGWVGFDLEGALQRPVRVLNDAAMQAVGAYDGGRMLFLGLGTGLGSTMIAHRIVVPLELGCLPAVDTGDERDFTLMDQLGKAALARDGQQIWQDHVRAAVQVLARAMVVDYVVLGGGHAALVDPLPPRTRRGGNEDAFDGGFRLWNEPFDLRPHEPIPWRVVC